MHQSKYFFILGPSRVGSTFASQLIGEYTDNSIVLPETQWFTELTNGPYDSLEFPKDITRVAYLAARLRKDYYDKPKKEDFDLARTLVDGMSKKSAHEIFREILAELYPDARCFIDHCGSNYIHYHDLSKAFGALITFVMLDRDTMRLMHSQRYRYRLYSIPGNTLSLREYIRLRFAYNDLLYAWRIKTWRQFTTKQRINPILFDDWSQNPEVLLAEISEVQEDKLYERKKTLINSSNPPLINEKDCNRYRLALGLVGCPKYDRKVWSLLNLKNILLLPFQAIIILLFSPDKFNSILKKF